MRRYTLVLLLLFVAELTYSQIPVGKWRDHFAFKQVNYTAISKNRVYASSANGVFWYNPTDGLMGKLTTVNGLSDIGISALGHSKQGSILAVGYENGNIDLITEGKVLNVPDIMQKSMQGAKQINNFYFDGSDQLLISTGFGIVVYNLDKREVKDTYYIGEGGAECWVSQVIAFNGRLYAATENGLKSASENSATLFHYESWQTETAIPFTNSEYNTLAVFQNKLFANQSTGGGFDDALWVFNGESWSTTPTKFIQIRNISASQSHMAITSRKGIEIYTNYPSEKLTIANYDDFWGFNPNYTSVDDNGRLAVADNSLSLMYGNVGSWTRVKPNSPDEDRAYYILPTENDLYVIAGSRNSWWGNMYYPFSYHRLKENQWETTTNTNYFDAVRITQSPFHEDEFYVSTWGHGVVVYRNGEVVNHFNPENSPLQTIIPGPYCRIGGVAFDSHNNMWVTNAGVTNPISLYTAEGEWFSFPYQNQIASERISDIMLGPSNFLWIIVPSGGGLFVIDPGTNPKSKESHRAKKASLVAPDGSGLPNNIHSIAFDKNDYLWVGTSEGVLVSYNPHSVFEPQQFSLQRVKIPGYDEGYAAELLKSQVVTSIAVDGGNRKWFGTQRSGAYLQSADGSQELLHFTVSNSPLPSNNIQHIGIHPKTGEVFFATDKGILSYRGEATEPNSKFGKVYAFPNPVRPGFEGVITITGLVDETNVKITDLTGNLVFETVSLGGQATWDGKTLRGQKAATGVYLFFCSSKDGQDTAVGKILFVK
ncbi:MAG: two-component regulator propeller domain-containing protein [Bacteroidales bacterium]